MEKTLNILIFVVCFGSASWFISIQYRKFFDNEDLSLVSYRPINFCSKSKDQPPTYTVCIFKENIKSNTFKDSILKEENNLWIPNVTSHTDYFKFLTGKVSRNSKNNDISHVFQEIRFDEVVIDLIDDFIIDSSSLDKNGSRSFWDHSCIKTYFPKTHQNLGEICHSRTFLVDFDFDMASDLIRMDVSKLIERKMSLKIFIHHQNFLYRHFHFL